MTTNINIPALNVPDYTLAKEMSCACVVALKGQNE